MAYQAVNINPLDLKPSTAIGVSIPFSSPGVFTSVFTTKDQIKYNIINYLLTGKRERVFQPLFGAGLREQLFESITTESAYKIESTVRSGVEAYFPNVIIDTLKVVPNYNNNTINIVFSYSIANTGQTDEIILNFANGQ